MGADITFQSDKGEFYFRDAYNYANLAWVISLSYWDNANIPKKSKIKFFRKLKDISDSQIKCYVTRLLNYKEIDKNDAKEIIRILKSKVKRINDNWDIISKAKTIEWSV